MTACIGSSAAHRSSTAGKQALQLRVNAAGEKTKGKASEKPLPGGYCEGGARGGDSVPLLARRRRKIVEPHRLLNSLLRKPTLQVFLGPTSASAFGLAASLLLIPLAGIVPPVGRLLLDIHPTVALI